MLQTLLQNKFFGIGSKNFTGISLDSYNVKGLLFEQGTAQKYFIERNRDLPQLLKKIWENKKISSKKVKLTLKNPFCLVRYFSFPKMDKKKIRQALTFELNKYIPFPSNQVYFDFFVLKEINPSEIFIILAVAKKDVIDPILESFEKAGLDVSEIDLDSIALINFFLEAYPEENKNLNACVLDLGYDFSVMSILNKGFPYLTRDIKFSIKDIFEVVSRVRDIHIDDVENWALLSENKEDFLSLAQDNISNLCGELKSSFDYFEVNKGEQIDILFINRGLLSVEGLEDIFSKSLGTKISAIKVPADKWNGLKEDVSVGKLNSFKDNFSVVFGLNT
ncbi:MAG: pilus assembly protein PilM [Candidatus Omnitrophica bacterium]|nr:pilus assembly protein PilM [Candidatus Omnitrophota bacterium]